MDDGSARYVRETAASLAFRPDGRGEGTARHDVRLPSTRSTHCRRPATRRPPRRPGKEKGARRRLQYAAACQTS
ncbi:hypothetical protein DF160_15280 [Burkholderia anthina]|nr:hypothetical protein DF160_15280 [Burkholderia anthina]